VRRSSEGGWDLYEADVPEHLVFKYVRKVDESEIWPVQYNRLVQRIGLIPSAG